jgi:AraC-like DNA-binding protein
VDSNPVHAYEVMFEHLPEVGAYGFRLPRQPVELKEKRHPWHMVLLVRMGELRLVEKDQEEEFERVIRPGETAFIPGGVSYQSRETPQGTQFIWLAFKLFSTVSALSWKQASSAVQENFREELPPFKQSHHLILRTIQVAEEMDGLVRDHREIMENAKFHGLQDFGTRAAAAMFLYRLHKLSCAQLRMKSARSAASEQQARPESRHTALARQNILLHYNKSISLNTVAKSLTLNPSYLGMCFKKVTGQTIGDFIHRTKIEAAKSMLVTQQHMNMQMVAKQSGFTSTTYFCRVFKKLEKMTPTSYASKFRGGRIPTALPGFMEYKRRKKDA